MRARLLPIAVVALLLFALMTLVLLAVKGKRAESDSAEVVFEVNEVAEVEPFCFDPNSVTYEQLLELGVPKRTAVSLLKYRAAGGVFSIPEEFALCYGVSDSLYQALKPYIVIAPEFRVELANLKPMESTRDTVIRYEPFRVDTVGVAYLRTIGFSHRRAVAFLNYRDSRGGLRNIEEVRDCYVIPSVECDTLSRYMIFPEQIVRKEPLRVPIELNRSSLEELTKVVGMSLLVVVAYAQDSEQWSEVSYQEVEMSDQWSVVSDQNIEDAPTSYTLPPTSFQAYIEEQILPIIVGVATSIIALLSTLKGIFSALKSLKESKEQFDTDREKIKSESQAEMKKITEKYNEIKEEIKLACQIGDGLCDLKRKTEILAEEIANLSKIASLGFSESKELVSEGKQREIVILAGKNRELIDNEEI